MREGKCEERRKTRSEVEKKGRLNKKEKLMRRNRETKVSKGKEARGKREHV